MAVVSDTMVLILRDLINDVDSTSYTDARLKDTLVRAAFFVDNELNFNTSYTIDVPATGITPDPVVKSDSPFVALTTLKAACIIDRGEARTQAKQVAKVADGTSSVDTSARVRGFDMVLKQGNCAAYEQAKFEYQSGDLSVGQAILGPYSQDLGQIHRFS
jgi:hypothetical protein